MSFRQTIHGLAPSDRGFKVVINEDEEKVLISFDSLSVAIKHIDWLKSVEKNIGLEELNPQPYWGFADLAAKAGTKLHNCFYVQANMKREKGQEFYHYQKILKLTRFSFDNFYKAYLKDLCLWISTLEVDIITELNFVCAKIDCLTSTTTPKKFNLQFSLPPLEIQQEIAAHIQAIRTRARELEDDAKAEVEQVKAEVERMILGEADHLDGSSN